MKELITKVNNLMSRVRKLETLETPRTQGPWANRPTAPSTYQKYTDTDRGVEFYWNGTYWLSTGLFRLEMGAVVGTTGNTVVLTIATGTTHRVAPAAFLGLTGGIYLVERWVVTCKQAATFDATHYWQFNLRNVNNTGGTATFSQLSPSYNWAASGFTTAGTIYNYDANVAANNFQFNSTNGVLLELDFFIQGAGTGALTVYGVAVWVRLVG